MKAKEKINNVVCDKCTHRDVCAFKEKMAEYQQAIDEIESVYKEETNNMFSHLIRCKQYIFRSPDVIERDAENHDAFYVKKESVKDVENIIMKTVKKENK